MGPMATLALVDFGIQWIVGGLSVVFRTEQFFDLTGSLTYLLLTYASVKMGGPTTTRKLVVSGMAMTWALRLGSFLFMRVLRAGEDKRFHEVKHDAKRFLIWWTIQGVWVFVTLLPTLILNTKRDSAPLTKRDYLGWGLWVLGFLIEVAADQEKSAFRSQPDNAGHFIQSGLWSISRHPNYFGEIVMWTGIWISASSVMEGAEFLTVLCPAFVAFLLVKVSGIPILEKMAEKRWGQDPAYLAYRDNTAILIPYLW